MLRTACSLVFVCALAAPLSAQDAAFAIPVAPAPVALVAPLAPAPLAPVAPVAPVAPALVAPVAPVAPVLRRPTPLIPLYASFATLQALDYTSTARALSSGSGSEANPVMRSIAGSRAAFIAVKAGAAAGVILAGEKMWKKNRAAAVIFVAAMNGAVAAIVARNYTVR